jgi:hypothetical protein
MIDEIKKIISHHPLFFFFICYLSIILGFYLDENSIGGAKHDYIYHLHFVEGFKNNFGLAIKNFASNPDEFGTRNSPILFIIFGLLNRIFQLDYLKSETRNHAYIHGFVGLVLWQIQEILSMVPTFVSTFFAFKQFRIGLSMYYKSQPFFNIIIFSGG